MLQGSGGQQFSQTEEIGLEDKGSNGAAGGRSPQINGESNRQTCGTHLLQASPMRCVVREPDEPLRVRRYSISTKCWLSIAEMPLRVILYLSPISTM